MSGSLPALRIVRFQWNVWRFGLMLVTEDVGSMYGELGSRGHTWHVSFWVNPR